MGERRQEDQDGDVEFTKVTISMPRWMHDDLRRRARRRGISVTELMRRAVALDAVVFDPAHPTREIVLRDGDGSTERILQPL
jgi:Ribbon-helix-helix protein, copG family